MTLFDDVQLALAHHVPTGPNETAAGEAIARLLDSADAPASRTTFDPGHLTASAVVRDTDRGKVLLIHHEKLDRWLQPGGHIESGDKSLEAAARREVLEETGLSDLINHGVIDLDIHGIPARRDEPAHLHHDIRYLFDVENPEAGVTAVAGDGALALRWVDLADLANLDTDESVARLIRKALEPM